MSIFLTNQPTSLLENLCAITLHKRYATDDASRLYYYNKNIEVDFYIPKEAMAIQVSYSLEDPETRKREINALSLLHKAFPLKKALVITYDEEGIMETNGLTIEIVPVWKWLLQWICSNRSNFTEQLVVLLASVGAYGARLRPIRRMRFAKGKGFSWQDASRRVVWNLVNWIPLVNRTNTDFLHYMQKKWANSFLYYSFCVTLCPWVRGWALNIPFMRTRKL